MLRLELDSRLVEDAVLAALRGRPRGPYWAKHDALYAVANEEERDQKFAELHRTELEALDLCAPLRAALDEQPLIAEKVRICRVGPAPSARDEGAELFVARRGDASEPVDRSILLRLRPQAFCEPQELLAFLRHELQHIADMLDPAFGYDPELPDVEGGPMRLKLALQRYRVLWDTVIDGRLLRLGRALESARALRQRELTRAFPMLGENVERAFTRWFEAAAPTHAEILSFALDPLKAMGLEKPARGALGLCPLCQCTGVIHDREETALPPVIASEILADFPAWTPDDGICPQCVDLYRGRTLSRDAAGAMPGG